MILGLENSESEQTHPNLTPHELITTSPTPFHPSIHCLTLSASQSPLKSLTSHFQGPSSPYTNIIVGVWRLLQWSSQASRFFPFSNSDNGLLRNFYCPALLIILQPKGFHFPQIFFKPCLPSSPTHPLLFQWPP